VPDCGEVPNVRYFSKMERILSDPPGLSGIAVKSGFQINPEEEGN